jgi:hypothetical protein
MSVFRARSFQGFRFDPFKAPRRPRHHMLRWVLAMLGVGLLVRLWKQRSKPVAVENTIAGDYRVLSKTDLPLVR